MTRSFYFIAALSAIGGIVSTQARAAVITFNDRTLLANSYYQGPDSAPNDFTGTSSSWGSGGGATAFNHFSDVNLAYTAWAGFAYANGTAGGTPGFGNQQSSQPGGGSTDSGAVAPGENFVLGYHDSYNNVIPTLTLGSGEYLTGFYAANTAYAYHYMLSGLDGFADNPANKFGGTSGNDADYLRIVIKGYDSGNALTGSVDYYLADLRFVDNAFDFIRTGWSWVDLSVLGTNAQKVEFTIESSDPFAPSYFAGDSFAVAPEPSRALLALGGMLLVSLRRRRRA